MYRIYILSSIILVLFTSCAPQATALPTQLPTATMQPTTTPTPADKYTPTPTLEPWMVSLPDNVVAVEIEDGIIFGLDTHSERILQFNVTDDQWVEVVKELTINSCVAPEAIAAQDEEFKERTGIDLNDLEANAQGQKFLEALGRHQSVSFDPDVKDTMGIGILKTGVGLVSITEKSGGNVDSLLCVYGRTNAIPGETLSVVVGWVDGSGNYHPLGFGTDKTSGELVGVTPDMQMEYFQDLPDGAVLSITVHSFSQITGIDQVRSTAKTNSPNEESVRDLLNQLGGDQILQRFVGVNNVNEYWALMGQSESDIGLVPSGNWKVWEMEDITP